MKKRILNKELAEVVAQIRHGEMLFIADAGSGTSPKALHPLDASVQYIDLEAVTGSPSMQDIVDVLVDVGDFEGAIVTEDMLELNQRDYQFLVGKLGEKNCTTSRSIMKCATAARPSFRPATTVCMHSVF